MLTVRLAIVDREHSGTTTQSGLSRQANASGLLLTVKRIPDWVNGNEHQRERAREAREGTEEKAYE